MSSGLVLDPTVARVVLFDLLPRGGEYGEGVRVVNDGARTGGALINGKKNRSGHSDTRGNWREKYPRDMLSGTTTTNTQRNAPA